MEYKVLDYKIHLSNNVLDVLSKNRQITNTNFEIGGQLFGYKIDKDFFISDATVSNKVDKKSSISFFPNIIADQDEIDIFYKNGYDFLGNWHTHPQNIPCPSPIDIATMIDRYKKSKHGLNFYVLIIVGKTEFPKGISINIVNDKIIGAKLND